MHLPILLAAANDENINLWEMIQSVGWVLVPLVLLSVIILALIIFDFYWLRDSRVASAEFLLDARQNLKDRNLEDLIETCHHYKGTCAKVLMRVVEFARDNPETNLENLKAVAEAEGVRILTTGDITGQAEPLRGVACDVLQVAHHGAKSSSGEAFLREARPELALISVGHNNYGHPAPETLARLAGAGARVLRTDLGGAILLRIDRGQVSARTFLPLAESEIEGEIQ